MPPNFKPYLIRAMYEWCADQGFSPYVAVAVDGSCKVPMAYVKQGQIVLDISMQATGSLVLDNEGIGFQARFGGVAQHLYLPMHRILGLFPEHDQAAGVFFEVTESPVEPSPSADSETISNPESPTLGKSRITRVK